MRQFCYLVSSFLRPPQGPPTILVTVIHRITGTDENNPCLLKPDRGSGEDLGNRWFYSFIHNKCLTFGYKGAKGNSNNFATKESCEKMCLPNEGKCSLKCENCELCDPSSNTCVKDSSSPECQTNKCARVRCGKCQKCSINSKGYPKCVKQSGCCPDNTPPVNCLIDPCRFANKECIQSTHCIPTYCGGCNAVYYDNLWNRILKNKCVTEENKEKVCTTFPETGRCKAKFTRYYYDQRDQKCKRFRYGGCKGNANNFRTISICQAACNGTLSCPRFARPPTLKPGCYYNWLPAKNGFCAQPEAVCDVKEGLCPKISKKKLPTCRNDCNYDNDCEVYKKCCSDGCGRKCVDVESNCSVLDIAAPPEGCDYRFFFGPDGCEDFETICENEQNK